MKKAAIIFFFLALLIMIIPVSAEMGYVIHANVVGAEVYFGGWNAGTIDENHQLYILWEEDSTLATYSLCILADGYIEVMDTLDRPIIDQIDHHYYTLYPYDNSPMIFGTLHLVIKPNGGDLYLRKAGSSDEWEYYEPDYGGDNFFRYIPGGTYDLLIRKLGFIPVRDTVKIPKGNRIDLFYMMEEGEEDAEAAALGPYQFSVAPIPTPVPAGTLISSPGINSLWEVPLEDSFYCTAISPDASVIIAGIGNSRTARFRPDKIGKVYCFNSSGYNVWTQTTDGSVLDCALSDSGDVVVVGTDDGMLYCFDGQGYLLWKEKDPGSFVDVGLSSDGSYLVGGSSNGCLYFLDSTGTILWKYQINGIINSVAMSADGNFIVAGSADGATTLFDRSGNKLWDQKAPEAITSVSLSSDGSLIVAGSEKGNVYLFDDDGSIIREYLALGSVSNVQVSSGGNVVGVASDGKKLCLFGRDGSLFWEKSTPSTVEKICFSADGECIGTSCMRFMYLFDRAGEEIWSFEQSGRIIDMDMSANGSRISAGGNLFYYLDTPADEESISYGESGSTPSGASSQSPAEKTEPSFESYILFGAIAVVFFFSIIAGAFCLLGCLRSDDDEE